jgi:hypothetical protein
MADLTTFMCRLSGNLEASTSWNTKGPSKPPNGKPLPFYQPKREHVPEMTWKYKFHHTKHVRGSQKQTVSALYTLLTLDFDNSLPTQAETSCQEI